MAGGQSYTQIAGAGGSSDQARQAANKVAGINFLPNSLFGFTDLVPALRDNPFLTTLLLGGVTGASGQVAQNTVTGRPLTENVLASTLQGAGMMGAMHLGTSAFFGNLSQAMDAARESELRRRAPEVFADGTRAVMRGDLRFPVQEFNDYFAGKSLDPAAVAAELGAGNYGDAMRKPDGEVVVPAASFFGRLDPEHQAGLMPSVIDPNSGRTLSQYEAGGPLRWLDGLSQTDPEMASSPEWQVVKEDLRQQYVDRGVTPDDAELSATTAANIVSNLGRRVGMAPGEVLNAFAKFRGWDAPGINYPYDFETAEGIAEEHNRANTQVRVLPEDKNGYAAIALNPDAYAFLRKQTENLSRSHWAGVRIHPNDVSGLVKHIENVGEGLRESEKTPLIGFAKAIRENRTPFGGVTLIRDGMNAWQEGMAKGEESGHSFQDIFPVEEKDWLDKHPEVGEKAKQALRGQYEEDELPDEISAKLIAGDRMGLSVQEAEALLEAYTNAIGEIHGDNGLYHFPEFEGSLERFYGEQPGDREVQSGTTQELTHTATDTRAGVDAAGNRGRTRLQSSRQSDIGANSRQVQSEGRNGSEGEGREGVGSFPSSDANALTDAFNNVKPYKFQKAIEGIREVVASSKEPGHAPQKATIGPVDPWIIEAAKEQGHDLEGFNHVIDGSAVRHTIKKHGNALSESRRGQVAVTDEDFEKIPQVLDSPDLLIFGTKNSIGRDQIGYVKRMSDGSTIYIEEVRTGKKELATASMWKYPATMDVSRLEAAPHHYVRGDSRTTPIVVRNPNAGKGEISD